ncbi:MAG: queuosine precursor transporter [Deltaproteobacteria bacterium]|jgi:uncharacterized integral membrane protein (TIGR00697 family)|nr:queuosine precursor transporter [Deltaproteobacteria bacterium]
MQNSLAQKDSTLYLEFLTGLFAGLLIISNIASTRLVTLGFLEFDAGTLIFPLTYIFGDLVTEVYGYARFRRIIWTALICLTLSFLVMKIITFLPAPAGLSQASAWNEIIGLTPRIMIASLIAFWVGEFANAILVSKMKSKNPHQGPAGRFVVSTLVGQAFDTTIFALIAFYGILSQEGFVTLLYSNYIFKVGIEILFLPLTLFIVRNVKRAEKLDVLDTQVSLNPFAWR